MTGEDDADANIRAAALLSRPPSRVELTRVFGLRSWAHEVPHHLHLTRGEIMSIKVGSALAGLVLLSSCATSRPPDIAVPDSSFELVSTPDCVKSAVKIDQQGRRYTIHISNLCRRGALQCKFQVEFPPVPLKANRKMLETTINEGEWDAIIDFDAGARWLPGRGQVDCRQ